MEVCVELPHYGLYCRAVILCHTSPPLCIQHCPYSRRTLIKLLYSGFFLDGDPTSMVVASVSAPDLISSKMGVVIYKVIIIPVGGGAALTNRLTRDWSTFGSVVTLGADVHGNLWLKPRVLRVLQWCQVSSLTCG
jgi:hypothetical protein